MYIAIMCVKVKYFYNLYVVHTYIHTHTHAHVKKKQGYIAWCKRSETTIQLYLNTYQYRTDKCQTTIITNTPTLPIVSTTTENANVFFC